MAYAIKMVMTRGWFIIVLTTLSILIHDFAAIWDGSINSWTCGSEIGGMTSKPLVFVSCHQLALMGDKYQILISESDVSA